MEIAFIGTGYVGLVSGVMLCHLGHDVLCIDLNKDKIHNLQNGILPIFENDLEGYFKQCLNNRSLKFKSEYDDGLRNVKVIFIAVGTPPKDDGEADLSHIFSAIDNLIKYIDKNSVLVIKSTVPPGSCLAIERYIKNKYNKDIEIVANPEFLREGTAVNDFVNPDRIVVGTKSIRAQKIMEKVYQPLIKRHINFIHTDLNSAELIKYASNSFLATKIAFINELSNLCEKIDADINIVSNAVGLDKRINNGCFKAGPGFGGSCFPKDILALSHIARKYNSNFFTLNAVVQANAARSNDIIEKIMNIFDDDISDKHFLILGLAYKAGTDDVRNSPAIEIIKLLQKKSVKIKAYDPHAMQNSKAFYPNIECVDIKDADFVSKIRKVKKFDAIIITSEWQEFKDLDFYDLKRVLIKPVIIDLRNILDRQYLEKLNYRYYCIGQILHKNIDNIQRSSENSNSPILVV